MYNKVIMPANKTGFTLIEIIIVLAVIGLVAAAIFVVVDPTKRFGDTQNALRDSNCDQIEKCLSTIIADNNGSVPAELSAIALDTPLMLVSAGGVTTGTTNCASLGSDIARVDLASLIEPYIGSLPVDSLATTSDDTGYFIKRIDTSVFTVDHCFEYTATVAEEEGGGGGGFSCGDTVDYEGVTYDTVAIGTQCWFAENLNVGTYVTGGTTQYSSCASAANMKKYCYADNQANCTTYGGIYQWDMAVCGATACNGTGEGSPACATPIQGICPVGWHIPSHYELNALERAVCTSGSCVTDFPYDTSTSGLRGTTEGTKLKVGGGSGFEFVLGGSYDSYEGSFISLGTGGFIWSSTKTTDPRRFNRYVLSSSAPVGRTAAFISGDWYAYSVRCVQD